MRGAILQALICSGQTTDAAVMKAPKKGMQVAHVQGNDLVDALVVRAAWVIPRLQQACHHLLATLLPRHSITASCTIRTREALEPGAHSVDPTGLQG